ncbi:MAG: MIP/aquaporin family protein [Actinomycetes bacterium]|nr:aquaporin [Actinomycetes bacterium]
MTQLDLRRLVAEFAGAAILVFGGAGAAVISSSNPFITAIGHLFALGIAIYLFMGISGAHLNPAVSVALAAGRHFPWRHVPAYVIAQLLGGITGAALLAAAYGDAALDAGLGATRINPGVAITTALYIEAFGAFILVMAVMAFAVNPAAPRGLTGLGIGGALAIGILVLAPTTGAAFNWARELGPEVVLSITGNGSAEAWKQMYVYVLGPVIGAALAVLIYGWLARLTPADDVPEAVEDEEPPADLDEDTATESAPA